MDPAKDFGPIADDYAFFEAHSTEAEQDVRAYVAHLGAIAPSGGSVRMLDFGCGSGTVTARFLEAARWPPSRVRLMLVEPVESARHRATERARRFTDAPVVTSESIPPAPIEASERFNVILANHVLYYVPDLRGHLERLIGSLSPTGVFLAAMAARTNALIQLWVAAFRILGRDVPYHTSEDVETALKEMRRDYHKREVAYDLTFRDTEENRMRIVRFLLADHLAHLPRRPLLDWFDQHATWGEIRIRTTSDHFTVRHAIE